MRKFILKSALFIVPFIILYITTLFLYSESESPDLLRLGYIPHIHKNYRDVFSKNKDEKFEKLSNAKKKEYKILTIGDSFSEQGADGYKNFLANDFTLLHIDNFISKNPTQTLFNLCNSDFFENYHLEYVILQNVERNVIENIKNIEMSSEMSIFEIDSIVEINEVKEKLSARKIDKYSLFSRTTIEFPLYYLPKYILDKNYLSNDCVYNFELSSKSVFSNHSKKLLFYHVDIRNTEQNNNIKNCKKLNNLLNVISSALRKKNIKLIFMVSPDKYDLYYDLIANKKGLLKPIFYDNFKYLKKGYLFLDAKSTLSEYIYTNPDLYFYDDTHWSPIASKLIADKIKETINNYE